MPQTQSGKAVMYVTKYLCTASALIDVLIITVHGRKNQEGVPLDLTILMTFVYTRSKSNWICGGLLQFVETLARMEQSKCDLVRRVVRNSTRQHCPRLKSTTSLNGTALDQYIDMTAKHHPLKFLGYM